MSKNIVVGCDGTDNEVATDSANALRLFRILERDQRQVAYYDGGGSTIPLLQNVEILAVGQRVNAPAENKVNDKELRSVTLLVTLEQATMLALGQTKGILHLSLRNPNDHKPTERKVVTLEELRFLQSKPVNMAPSKP
jgi:pilus assembly protein CpaB